MMEIKIMCLCVMGVILLLGVIGAWITAKIEKDNQRDLELFIDNKVQQKLAEAKNDNEEKVVKANAETFKRD